MLNRRIKRNKKGQLTDFFTIAIALLVLGITIVGAFIFYKVGYTALGTSGMLDVDLVNQTVGALIPTIEYTIDYFPLFVYFGFTLALCLSAFFIESHSGFFFLNIIALFPMAVFAAVLSNAYGELVTNSVISGYLVNADGSTALTKTTFIMQYLPWLMFVVIIVVTLVMYTKSRQ